MAKLKPAKQSTASKATITTPSDRAAGTKRKRDEVIPATPRKPAKAVKQEMQDCDICAETRVVYRNFPRISSCDHERTVCLDCYKTHFVSKINEDRALGWLACNCPLCAEPVSQEDAQSVLPRSLSKELDQMIRQVRTTELDVFLQQRTDYNRHKEPQLSIGYGVQQRVVVMANSTN